MSEPTKMQPDGAASWLPSLFGLLGGGTYALADAGVPQGQAGSLVGLLATTALSVLVPLAWNFLVKDPALRRLAAAQSERDDAVAEAARERAAMKAERDRADRAEAALKALRKAAKP